MTTPTTTPQAPLSLYGFLRPKPERAEEVRQLLSSLVEPTRREDGNLEYHLHEHEDGRLFLYEVWRSQEDLDRHNAREPLRGFLANLLDYLVELPEGYFNTMISPYPAANSGGTATVTAAGASGVGDDRGAENASSR
ncbi:putative quinol monooxygenase [Streptomyces sparsogenes]|uniref:putative quinol monooxygenase n=1 Tax=Streptomyces sparsogenes TaxID=67365 RepID=UPI00331E5101